jgi:hypothetical protein
MEASREGRLYRQLPAFWRQRDAEAGGPLRALLGVIEAQAALIEDDTFRLHDGLFVETADPWAVPYIGDLVGTSPLFDVSSVPEPPLWRMLFPDLAGAVLGSDIARLMPAVAARARPDVAKTIYYRRRKGTAPMLEELARDVTGWPARLVEFFATLGWTQALRNHVRPGAGGWTDLRSTAVAERIGGAFDATTRSADMRPFVGMTGRHGVPKIGFFLWRLRPQQFDGVSARAVSVPADWRWRASPLGQDAPLFIRLRREDDEAGQATELHLPGPIRPGLLHADLVAARAAMAAASELVGPFGGGGGETSLSLTLLHNDGTEEAVPAHRVRCMALEPWARPLGDLVGVDVRRGRIALGEALSVTGVRVGMVAASVADLGGGTYGRAAWLLRNDPTLRRYIVGAGGHATLRAALAEWAGDGKPDAVIRIMDSRSYHETLSGPLAIEPADPDPVTGRRGLLAIEGARICGLTSLSPSLAIIPRAWSRSPASWSKARSPSPAHCGGCGFCIAPSCPAGASPPMGLPRPRRQHRWSRRCWSLAARRQTRATPGYPSSVRSRSSGRSACLPMRGSSSCSTVSSMA